MMLSLKAAGKLTASLAAVALAGMLAVQPASAQVVAGTVDPYELAPRNVHLYPISLNARMPFQYLPPIFSPRPMWRGALTTDELLGIAPHNWGVAEVPDSTALVAWGTVKGKTKKKNGKTIALEAANQQEFLITPPSALGSDDFIHVRTEMRCVPRERNSDIDDMFERALITTVGPRVNSIADGLPVDVLMYNYERVQDVADLQPRIQPALLDELGTALWPVDRVYTSYSGWRRDPGRMRSLGDFVPQWLTYEGRIVAWKRFQNWDYMLTVSVSGYNPWYPDEVCKNVMRKLIARSFDEFVEPTRYYDVELPLGNKEWMRQGSGNMRPYDTRKRVGGGGAGQGAY